MEARYRASMCKTMLENVEAEVPRVLARLDEDDVAQIRSASRTDWIPAAAVERLYATVMTECGEDGLRDINRAYTRKAMDFSVFGPLVKGATNLFGGLGFFGGVDLDDSLLAQGRLRLSVRWSK